MPEYITPGVYVVDNGPLEMDITPPDTAVPAFIGYTPRAQLDGASCLDQAVEISSMADYLTCFGAVDAAGAPAASRDQYRPRYRLSASSDAVEPDPGTIYYLYDALRLYFANGGERAYVCSVGTYGPTTGSYLGRGDPLVNPNVRLEDLERGLAALTEQHDATLLVTPDANLLARKPRATLMQAMLRRCEERGDTFALLDVTAGRGDASETPLEGLEAFREDVGVDHLGRGAAYYPFLRTTVVSDEDVDPTDIEGAPTEPTALAATVAAVRDARNVLPPSSAMAGLYAKNDRDNGVWHAPANVTVRAVTDVVVRLDDAKGADFNVDPVGGKSVDVIRFFEGRGVLVWGARTLDGNSAEHRYVNVRRTVTMIEQAAKLAMRAHVFDANDQRTWDAVRATLTQFLTDIWKQGGLQGASPAQAFSVEIGLGASMTPEDVAQGIMRTALKVAVVHPAEFIVLLVEQAMAVT